MLYAGNMLDEWKLGETVLRFWYAIYMKWVKNLLCGELFVLFKQEISYVWTYYKDNVYVKHMGEFWCFFVMTSFVEKLLNWGHFECVSLYFITSFFL
jgi:hypothetical protein